ncbi:beta-ketoacyl synthase N-terminal-like domain-containing protein [Pseudonocardia sp. NPDC049635]|uniref:type I polyketide synthase n=1 Tax=Pseudonocardia sp. NPDC049635 TaxID=3155506 RepID=UPI0033E5D22F
MTTTEQDRLLEYLRRVTADLHRTRTRLAEVERAAHEPIAVVGMGCRFPGGVRSPQDLWDLVIAERDAVGPFPTDRGWDLAALSADTTVPGRGAFLDDAAEFDAGFFGVTPREARAMDPQQRLLLEVAWETVEHAGIDPRTLRGTATGVFVGGTSFQYGGDLLDAPEELGGHLLTGTVTSVLSGRISYLLGTEGPSMSFDTACSSSLVAMHLAAQALRRGDCTAALAGGVAVMSTPGVFAEFAKQGGLAPDGRCKSFADAADGTGWGEGAGLVLLEPLSAARERGHRVLAVLRGSAWNCDGASHGMTAPNGPAQQRVVRAALADAGLTPADVDAVEAHGTGTRLGDPIEAGALLATYGRDRDPARPLHLGSVKSNIGHTQAAAGAGSVIKTVLALQHGRLARTLHVDAPSTGVPWSTGAVELLLQARDWPDTGRPRRAGVSAFGISGTNAHLVLEQAEPEAEPAGDAPPQPRAWPLAGRGPAARGAQAAALARAWDAGTVGTDPHDIAAALANRTAFEDRAVVLGTRPDELRSGLDRVADPGPATLAGLPAHDDPNGPAVVLGTAARPARPVFVFPGQGSQWTGMAVELMAAVPAFRERMDACLDALGAHTDLDLRAALHGTGPAADRVDVVQPLLFAVMVALAGTWRAHGVEPTGVIGHSQGEIAAAHVAGALTLDDAARVCAVRSRALTAIAGSGSMLTVAAAPGAAADLAAAVDAEVSVAAENGPGSTVLAGTVAALTAVRETCAARDVRTWWIDVDYASHSPAVEVLTGRLLTELDGIAPRDTTVPLYSTVTGEPVRGTTLGAGYWVRNLRQPVRLADATRVALDRGHRMFVETTPHPVLATALRATAEAAGTPDVTTVGTLRRGDGGVARLLHSFAEAWVAGAEVDWSATGADRVPRRVDLPTYPFQRERFWYTSRPSARTGDTAVARWRLHWRSRPEPTGRPSGTWLLVDAAGHRTPVVPVRDALVTAGALTRTLLLDADGAPTDGTTLEAAVAAALEGADDVRGAVVLLGTADSDRPDRPGVPHGLAGMLRWAAAPPLRTWWVTHGAAATGHPLGGTAAGALAGVVAAAEAGEPDLFGGHVDLPAAGTEPGSGPAPADRLVALLTDDTGERWAVRPDGVRVARLAADATGTGSGGWWRPDGTVLVTGAFGALGAHAARLAAEAGAGRLVLLGRRGTASPGAAELVGELRAGGAQVEVAAVDVTDRAAVAGVLDAIPADRPLRAVVHAAGVPDAAAATAEDVVAPALGGAAVLDELTRGHTAAADLDAFVLFPALAGVLGAPGSWGRSAASAGLLALARARRAAGLPVTAAMWTAWAPDAADAPGAGSVDPATAAVLSARGCPPIDRAAATRELRRLLAADPGDGVVVGDVDWERYTAGGPVPPVLAELAEPVADPARRGPDLAARIAGVDPGTARRTVRAAVADQVATALGFGTGDALPAGRSFRDLGVDSLTAVALRNAVAAATGLDLPVTTAFDHPDVDALTDHVVGRLAGAGARDAARRAGEGIDGLADLLDGLDLDADDRTAVTARLRELLRDWEHASEVVNDSDAADATGTTDTAPADPLRGATDDEMFALLDDELGRTA